MGIAALTIINASFDDMGIRAVNEPLGAPEAQDGLRRLNNLVSSWRTQFETVTAIERQIFPLVSNQQTYYIGIGGNFNVPRPLSVTGAGLLLNGLASFISVTIARSGIVATVTQASHPYSVGDEAVIQGANELPYNGVQTVQSVPTSGTWTFTVEGAPTATATGTITAARVNAAGQTNNPVEIPIPVITDDIYQLTQIKNQPNSLFTNVYYNTTYPLGTVVLWPRINTATNQLVLYLQNQFLGFADLTTEYDWPDLPGYSEALQYNLDIRLSAPYGRPVPDHIADQPGKPGLASTSLGLIKRANLKLNDQPNEAVWATQGNRRGWYNINTGNM